MQDKAQGSRHKAKNPKKAEEEIKLEVQREYKFKDQYAVILIQH